MIRKYTVIMQYPEGSEGNGGKYVSVSFVEADSPRQAAIYGQQEAHHYHDRGHYKPEDWTVTLVLSGHVDIRLTGEEFYG